MLYQMICTRVSSRLFSEGTHKLLPKALKCYVGLIWICRTIVIRVMIISLSSFLSIKKTEVHQFYGTMPSSPTLSTESNHTQSASSSLSAGWTEHKAPSGHVYYYNAVTKESTYRRPQPSAIPPPIKPPSIQQLLPLVAKIPQPSFSPSPLYPSAPTLNLSNPHVANAFMRQQQAVSASQNGSFLERGGADLLPNKQKPRRQPNDKPRSKTAIPGCEPWVLVTTKYERRFVHNPVKGTSYWRIPEKLQPAILALDKARILGREIGHDDAPANSSPSAKPSHDYNVSKTELGSQTKLDGSNGRNYPADKHIKEEHEYDSSEYEVEVEAEADDESDGGEMDAEIFVKRQKLSADAHSGPVEFDETDIAFQLQAMIAEEEQNGLDETRNWSYELKNLDGDFTPEEAEAAFKAMFDDFGISPYSSWEKIIEEGHIINDRRYTLVTTMKSRKLIWEDWSRAKIKQLQQERAVAEKKDPLALFLALLREKATPKLYWPEFKRKYRKEEAMKSASPSDRDKEKMYREYVQRLKLPLPTLKADLTKLLNTIPLSKLNRSSTMALLPTELTTDMRYACLIPSVREPMVEAYIQTLESPPDCHG